MFVCVAKAHPDNPGKHYFSLDTEATLDRQTPSNAKLESALETFFRTEIRKLGGMAIKLVPTSKGIPDRLVVLPGKRHYFVELKAEQGRTSAAQQLWHDRLGDIGHPVVTLYGRAEIKDWIALITEEAGPKFRKRSNGQYDDLD